MSETALIVEVAAAEPLVGPWRAHHDPVASRGVPGHVTALYPFVTPDDFDEATLDGIRRVLNDVAPFEFVLSEIAEFDDVIWLRPNPESAFRELTQSLWREFPDHPPYRGRFEDVQPHLTIAMTGGGRTHQELGAAIRADIAPHLPITARADALSVFVSDEMMNWRRRHHLPFGG